MILRKLVSLIGLLTACSALNPDLCKDGTTNFKTFHYRVPIFNSTTVIGIARDATPCKWVIKSDAGSNLSISIDSASTKLLGPKCSSVWPYYSNSSTLLIRTYVNDNTNYDVRICPDQLDSRSYVSTNRIEVFHCQPKIGDKFKLRVEARIAGTRRATPENRAVAIKRSSHVQWMKLETAKDGIVLNLVNVQVRAGKNGKCKAGYITVTDSSNGQSILPQGLDKICNRSDGTLKSMYWVISKLQSIKLTFKNAKFSMVYYSSPLKAIDDYLRTSAPSSLPTTTTTTTPILQVKSTTSDNKSAVVLNPRNGQGSSNTDDGDDENNDNSGFYEAIGLGCAAAVVLIAVAVGFIALRKRRINQRRMSTKPSDDSPPLYMDRLDLGSSDGVRSIDNVMYEKVLKSNASGGNNTSSATVEPPASRDRLLGKEAKPKGHYPSDTEKRRQRLSQLEEVYLGIENKPESKPNGGVRGPLLPPEEVPITPLFHNDRPPLPPPEPGSPHYYAAINDIEEEIPSVSYACVTKQNGSKEKKVREADYASGKRDVTQPPVALYVSSDELHQGAPSISLSPSEEYLDKQSQLSIPAFPPLDKDGYLSLTSEENFNPSMSDDVLAQNDRSYVQANSVSQEDVRKHFAIKKQKIPRPGIDKSVATSMPELVHQKRRVNKAGFPASKQQSDRLHPPQSGSAMRRYRQPRPSAPDIFIQTAYTSGEDLSRIREHLERVAAAGRAESASNFNVQPPSDNSSRTAEDSTGSGASYYDSPRPSIDSSQDSLLGPRGPANFYDAPRPSLPCIFPDDLRRIVESSENLRM